VVVHREPEQDHEQQWRHDGCDARGRTEAQQALAEAVLEDQHEHIKQFSRSPRPTPPKELDELTAREQEILRLIAGGLSNGEIGQELYIDTTVKTHVTHILRKLNLRDRVQAVVLAYQAGFFETEARRPEGTTQ